MPGADPAPCCRQREGARVRTSISIGMTLLLKVILPFLSLFVAALILWGWGFSWVDFGVLVGKYALTVFGIAVGFHRLFPHRSFETTRGVKLIFGIRGSIAVQAPLIKCASAEKPTS
jgi:stearoyl-CoA desaturase (delta-9 desaturase)